MLQRKEKRREGPQKRTSAKPEDPKGNRTECTDYTGTFDIREAEAGRADYGDEVVGFGVSVLGGGESRVAGSESATDECSVYFSYSGVIPGRT